MRVVFGIEFFEVLFLQWLNYIFKFYGWCAKYFASYVIPRKCTVFKKNLFEILIARCITTVRKASTVSISTKHIRTCDNSAIAFKVQSTTTILKYKYKPCRFNRQANSFMLNTCYHGNITCNQNLKSIILKNYIFVNWCKRQNISHIFHKI